MSERRMTVYHLGGDPSVLVRDIDAPYWRAVMDHSDGCAGNCGTSYDNPPCPAADTLLAMTERAERAEAALRDVAAHLDEALLPQDWACTECLASLGQEPLADPFHCWYHRLVALLGAHPDSTGARE